MKTSDRAPTASTTIESAATMRAHGHHHASALRSMSVRPADASSARDEQAAGERAEEQRLGNPSSTRIAGPSTLME